MAEKISVSIELAGGKEVEQQLADIGQTGTKAFEDISTAASATEQITEPVAAATQEVTKLGDAAAASADKTTESFKRSGLETAKLSLEIGKLSLQIAKLGVEIGLAVQTHRGWISTLLSVGSAASSAVRAVALLAPGIGAAGVAAGGVALGLGAVAISLEALNRVATRAAAGTEKVNHTLQTLAATSGQSFESLQRNQAAFEQIGIKAETFREVIAKLSETLAKIDVGADLKKSANEAKVAVDEVLRAEKELLEAQLKRQEAGGDLAPVGAQQRILEITEELKTATGEMAAAEDRLAEARKKSAEAAANNLTAVLAIVKQIGEGQKDIKFDELVTSETKIKAVAAALKQVSDAGGNAAKALLEIIQNARSLKDALTIGAAFGLTEADVDRVRRYGTNLSTIDDLWRRIQGAGVLISPASAAAFDKMRGNIQQVDSAWTRLKQSLETTIFASMAASFSAAMNDLKAAAINAAAAIIEKFNEIANEAIRIGGVILTNIGGALKQLAQEIGALDFFKGLDEKLRQSISGLNAIVANIVGGVMKGMGVFAPEQIKAVQNEIMGIANVSKISTTEIERLGLAGKKAGEEGTEGFRAWGDILKEVEQGSKKAGEAAAAAGEQGAKGFRAWEDILKEADEVGKKSTQSLEKTAEAAKKVGSKAAEGMEEFDEEFALLSDLADSTKEAIAQFDLAPSMEASQKVAAGVKAIALQLSRVRQGLSAALAIDPSVAGDMEELTGNIERLLKTATAQEKMFRPASASAEEEVVKIEKAFADIDLTPKPIQWSDIGQGAKGGAETIKQIFIAAMQDVGATISQFAASLSTIDWSVIFGAGVAAWNTLKAAVATAGAAITQFAAGLGGVVWDAISAAGVAAWTTIKTAIVDAGAAIQQFASQLPGIVWDTIASAGVAAWQAIVAAVQEAGLTVQQFASSLGGIVWDAIAGAGVAAWNAITQAIRDAINAIGEFLGLTGGAAGGAVGGAARGGQVGSFQGGGLLGGRGTGTSDSNLVRVSRGEYIVPARAVRQPGVLDFLEALRRSGGSLRDVLDDMGRFALGGLMPRTIPAFAAGGLAGGGMSNVTIQFPGMPEISGLRAPAKVVEELRKTAALAQVRSGGRKPSRYS